MNNTKMAVFLGGVAVRSSTEGELAYDCGKMIGRLGYTLLHGGYNGLMEDAARGAATEGANIVALTLADKQEWGAFNPYVTKTLYARDFGQRLNNFFSSASIVIAMGGGVGTLHEIAAAIWYAGNIRNIPVILLGTRGRILVEMLKEQEWIYESPTRPLDFLHFAATSKELNAILSHLDSLQPAIQDKKTASLAQEVFEAALIDGKYVRADGTELKSYFDPFQLSTRPKLLYTIAMTAVTQIKGPIDTVAGIALGGVTLATYIALILDKPLLMIRPVPKTYGTYSQVEGTVSPGSRVLIVDDVVRHGTAMVSAQNALNKMGLNGNEALCILSYGDAGHDFLGKNGIVLHSIFCL